MLHDDAEPREAHQRRAQVLDAGVRDADLGARHRRQPDERADLDVIGADACVRAAERAPAVDGEHVGADAVDLARRARRGNAQRSCTCGSLAALRRIVVPDAATAAISAFSVPVTLGSSRNTSAPRRPGRRQVEAVVELERGTEALEREKVRVDATPADHVAARRRQRDLAAAREQRAGQQDRRANLLAQRRDRASPTARSSRGCAACSARSSSRRRPVDAISSTSVSMSRMRGTFSRMTGMLGEQRRADDRQRGVLVAGRANGSGELLSSLDDVLQCAHVRAVR